MKNSPVEMKQIQRIPSVYVDTKRFPGYAWVEQWGVEDQVLILDKEDAERLIKELEKFVGETP